MRLNKEYKPIDCCDLSDIKAGLNRLFDICSDIKKPLISRRIRAYNNRCTKLKINFNPFTYFIKIKTG